MKSFDCVAANFVGCVSSETHFALPWKLPRAAIVQDPANAVRAATASNNDMPSLPLVLIWVASANTASWIVKPMSFGYFDRTTSSAFRIAGCEKQT